MQGESSRAPGPAHEAAPPGDLGRGATDLELLNWMRSQHQMPPVVVGTFLVVLRILL